MYKKRPIIISLIGHVNHGKTSLLDYIRKTNIVKKEYGNITQNINAYYYENKKLKITFLDTPGHEAFFEIRKKSFNLADMSILIIAADVGITLEVKNLILLLKEKKIPLIVVINKIDKVKNIDYIINDLNKENIISIEKGGNYIIQNISVKKGIGIDDLLNKIYIKIKELNIKSNINYTNGVIIDSKIDKKRGNCIILITKNGQIKIGDYIVTGGNYGKIRFILKNKKNIKNSELSIPLEIYGLNDINNINKNFIIVYDKNTAIKLTNEYKKKNEIKNKINNKNFFLNFKKKKNIKFIIKSNLFNTLDVIIKNLNEIINNNKNEDVDIIIINKNIGDINENDISLAKTFNAIILGFNIKINNIIKKKIKQTLIKIYFFNIIYELIDTFKKIILGKKLKNILNLKKKITGKAEIKNIFNTSNKKNIIAGCYITYGYITINSLINIIRNNKIIWKGKIKCLKRFKNNINKIESKLECGIEFKKYNKFKINDKIESYEI